MHCQTSIREREKERKRETECEEKNPLVSLSFSIERKCLSLQTLNRGYGGVIVTC
jgi:hypothetical protein